MRFNKHKYQNRVKVLPSQYPNLYDTYLQEFVPEDEASMSGESIGPELLPVARTIWFTVESLTKGMRIGPAKVGESVVEEETAVEESFFGDAAFGWDSPYEPAVRSRNTISFLGCNRPVRRMSVSIKPSDPNNLVGVAMFASLEHNDFEFPEEEALFIDLWIAPQAFRRLEEELDSGRVEGVSLSLNTEKFHGFYSPWSPIYNRDISIKALVDLDLVVNPGELPDGFGEVSGRSRDFGLTIIKRKFDLLPPVSAEHALEMSGNDQEEPLDDLVTLPTPKGQPKQKKRWF